MLNIICIFALWIGWSSYQLTRGKSVAPSTFEMTDFIKSTDNMEKKPLDILLSQFYDVHKGKYSYDNVSDENYKNNRSKIPVVCKEHGLFYIAVGNHLSGQGCPICANIQRRLSNTCNVRKRPKLVWGIAVNDYDGNIKYNKVHIPSYRTWEQMMKRCYSEKYKEQNQTYKECSVCKEWLSFSKFKEWFDANYVDGYALDKDILIKGNKLYSPQTCCFVPSEINGLFTKTNAKRGNLPVGVSYTNRVNDTKYIAYVGEYGERVHLGTFDTPFQAFNAYKQEKERYIKEVAKKYYKDGRITERVYNAMMNYQVEITD